MKLKDVGIAVPFIEYNVEVGYRIRRKPVVMEWVIIQMIAVAEQHREYADIPVSRILNTVFGIVDVDSLVRPVMISMLSAGLIAVSGLTDDSPLDGIRLRDCSLTDDGRLMLRDGTLPTQASKKELQLTYDVLHHKLVPGKSLQKDPLPKYVQIQTGDELRDIPFPQALIQSYLVDVQKRNMLPWLKAGAEITGIAPIFGEMGTKNVWNNIRRHLEVGPGGICRIDEFGSPELLQRVSAQLPPMPSDASAWPLESGEDIDSKVSAWTWPDSLSELLIGRNQSVLFITREKNEAQIPERLNPKSLRITILADSSTFEMKPQLHQLTVRVNGSLLPPQIAIAGSGFAVHLGRFLLDFGGSRREVALAWIPKQESFDTGDLVRGIVKNYASAKPNIVALLRLTQQDEAFVKQLQEMAGSMSDLGNRAKFLMGVQNLCSQITGDGSSAIPDELMAELLAGSVAARKYAGSAEDAGKFLTELRNIFKEIQGDHRPLFVKAVQNVVRELPSPSGINETWHILDQLASSDVTFPSAVEKDAECLRHLYPDAVINDVIAHLSPEFVEKAAERRCQMPLERTVVRLPQIVDRVLFQLGGIPEEECSAALIRSSIAKDATEKLMSIYDLLQQWNEAKSEFSEQVMEFSDACSQNSFLRGKSEFIDKVQNVLPEFCDPKELRYPNIVVPDTNAYLSHPELIETLRKNGRYLLLVPAVVLQELDGIKNAEDQELARNSRRVSGSLVSLVDGGDDWVKSGVESNTDLVPEETRDGSMGNDVRILSVALSYNAKPVFLVTDDNNLRLLCSGFKGIRAVSAENFLRMLDQEAKTTTSGGSGKKNSKKKK